VLRCSTAREEFCYVHAHLSAKLRDAEALMGQHMKVRTDGVFAFAE
jgi:hypothetical protein